jgi:hypothetical protein
MKTVATVILTILTLFSCNKQGKLNDSYKNNKEHYEEKSKSLISFGGHSIILGCKPTADNAYLLWLTSEHLSNVPGEHYRFLKITPQGDSISSFPFSFEKLWATYPELDYYIEIAEYIEYDNFFYAVITAGRINGADTKDYLCKFDKNWKLIWSKKVNNLKYLAGLTVLTITANKEIILVANEQIPNSMKSGISIRRYDLDGKIITENLMLTKGICNPISIIKSADNNYYLTAEQDNDEPEISSLWLLKLTSRGDTIWTKKYTDFLPHQTLLTSNSNLVLYGNGFYPKENPLNYLKIMVLDKEGNLQWQKEIKRNQDEIPGTVIETKAGNYLFSSMSQGEKTYLFELSQTGDLTFEKKSNYSLGVSPSARAPYLIKTDGQVTMIEQKRTRKSDSTIQDIIQVTKLTE